jgi:transcription initiation factor TFIIB
LFTLLEYARNRGLSGEDEEIMLGNSREVLEKGNKDKVMTEHVVQCSECGNTKFIRDYERAELTCLNCGLVVKDRMIDTGPEWRAFDHEQWEKRARAGTPTTYTIHDKGLSTMIDWRNRDSSGKSLAPGKRAQIYRLRKWQRRTRVSGVIELNLAFAFSELDRMASHLGLPRNVREASAVIYRKAVEQKLVRGRSIEGVAAAVLYAACRQCKVPRTLGEIAEVSRVSRKETGRSYRLIARELNIAIPPTNPVDYIPRFANQLNLSGEAQAKTVEILKHASMKGLTSGRGPTSVAAAAIYIASVALNERRTQRDVAEVARVTEVTLRNRYKELVEKLSL